jgi:polysaccharide export outer membrane protein
MRLSGIIVAFAVALAASVCGATFAQAQVPDQPPAPPASASASPLVVGEATSGAYVLGRDDVIRVGLLGRNDFGGSARVQADGSIQLPLVGKIQAAERTTSELAEAVRKALQTGGFYADPIVNIEVVSYASRYVTVLGSVGQAGLVPLNRPYRLSEILARVGGVREGAADYIIVRSTEGAEKHFKIRDLATGDAAQDPYVAAGDKIYAPVAEAYYIYGQVHAPGMFPMVSGDMTVRMAIAKAGGLTDSGSDKKVQVTRGGKQVTLDNTAKILPGDVLFISERLF